MARACRYPDIPEVGNLEADFFDPDRWKPEYPNPAFERMQPGGRVLGGADRRALLGRGDRARSWRTGRLGNPDAEAYLADTLIARRDKIVARYSRVRSSPLDGFRVGGRRASPSTNLGERGGPRARRTRTSTEWFAFDNATGARRAARASRRAPTSGPVPVPVTESYLVAAAHAVRGEHRAWRQAVDVFLRNGPAPAVVGRGARGR